MENSLKVTTPDLQSQLVRAIAYYRHSSLDRQESSIAIQKDHVRQWALEHGIEIIQEFCDVGQPGCNSDERPAFTEMLDEWIKQRSDFDYILCLDASRLGRFHGSDFSTHSTEVFKKYKKQAIYASSSEPQEE